MTVRIGDPRPVPLDPGRFRRVMGQFATGVTVITAASDTEVRGMTANAFISGSLSPPLCVVSVAKRAHMHEVLLQAKRFVVNVLSREQADVAVRFAGRSRRDDPVDFDWIEDVPMLAVALAHMAADIVAEHDCGDHTLFVGQLFYMAADDTREPLLYHEGRFGGLVHTKEDPLIAVPEFW